MKHEFEKYCKCYENIENFEKAAADNFKGWNCHHRLETHNSDGKRRLVDITVEELKALGMYYRRPAEELIFLTSLEHGQLHNKGKHPTEEAKKKNSEAKKGKHLGKDNPFYGKTHSAETKRKISEAKKGNKYFLGHKHSEEVKHKMSEAHKGHLVSEETLRKMSEAKKGMHWFNNGKIGIRAKIGRASCRERV